MILVLLACTGAPPGDSSTPGPAGDRDGDGYDVSADCDDRDPDVNPGIPTDGCDDVDNDCDGTTDEDPDRVWYVDADLDGFGAEGSDPTVTCAEPAGAAGFQGDCDDAAADVFPGNDEACDEVDNDCDGSVDEGVATGELRYEDADGDGTGNPDRPASPCDTSGLTVLNTLDCDDGDPLDPLFVAEGGTGPGTMAAPMGSVEDAVAASAGCVWVDAGTYQGTLLWPGRDVAVRSFYGPDYTFLVGDGGPVAVFWAGESRLSLLEGFTLTGGEGFTQTYNESYVDGYGVSYDILYRITFGGGLYVVGASPTLRNLVITGNETAFDVVTEGMQVSSYGGGAYIDGGQPAFEDVVFEMNAAAYGADLYIGGDAEVEGRRVRFQDSIADYGTIAIYESSLLLTNMVLNSSEERYGWDGIFVSGGTLKIDHGTVIETSWGVVSSGNSLVEVRNSIFTDNDYAFGDLTPDGSTTWRLEYLDVYGNRVDFYNMTEPEHYSLPPEFTDRSDDGVGANDDLHLLETSACRDIGDPATSDADGSLTDLGAYGGAEGGSW